MGPAVLLRLDFLLSFSNFLMPIKNCSLLHLTFIIGVSNFASRYNFYQNYKTQQKLSFGVQVSLRRGRNVS